MEEETLFRVGEYIWRKETGYLEDHQEEKTIIRKYEVVALCGKLMAIQQLLRNEMKGTISWERINREDWFVKK